MDMRMTVPFVEALQDIFKQMAMIEVQTDGDPFNDNEEVHSYGVSSIITFAGKIKGRFLIDLDTQVALQAAKNITGSSYDSPKEQMVLAVVSEMNNIISGNAITKLNNEYGLSLRLAPPIVFAGTDVVISIPKVASASVTCTTACGKLKASVAISKA
ncbi:chemotaxis protein CheX [Heliobacillus mobilis]|uniref:Chemotaxis protein CheX n=1 Tax=Heliobacterium mobile TaxID=28064 RepID=A0A6I3SJ77_HELMO|nr:chemotaxis protein CheX [Heliobacterium mobile]MTV48893.1 chemotaxis protein CheX [Heliobacterium mobile]